VIFVIGDVVDVRREIEWLERRPLHGWRILVTRALVPSSTLAPQLAAAGADVIEVPATRIEPLERGALRGAIAHLDAYDWLVFTSQNAVQLFWTVLREQGLDARALAGLRVAVVGPATGAALEQCGIAADVTPERFVGEALLDVFQKRDDVRGTRVLYAAAEGARDLVPDGLRQLGATVDVVPLYRSVPDSASVEAMRTFAREATELSLAAFTSASAVRAFADAAGTDGRRVVAASIGPVTSAAAREAGLEVVVEAAQSTIPGLVAAIIQHGAARTEAVT
jgi:uroporphyrinogen III methyltransferase/synthase